MLTEMKEIGDRLVTLVSRVSLKVDTKRDRKPMTTVFRGHQL